MAWLCYHVGKQRSMTDEPRLMRPFEGSSYISSNDADSQAFINLIETGGQSLYSPLAKPTKNNP